MTDALDRAILEYQADALPPAQLERRIVARLVKAGALARRRRVASLPWTRFLVAAAAIVVTAFLLLYSRGPGHDGDRMHYALVLDTVTKNYGDMDPGEAELLAERYTAWLERIRASGRLVDALYLEQPESDLAIDEVSGIVVVRVRSLEEAQAIVADSPHTARGGSISIREITVGENQR